MNKVDLSTHRCCNGYEADKERKGCLHRNSPSLDPRGKCECKAHPSLIQRSCEVIRTPSPSSTALHSRPAACQREPSTSGGFAEASTGDRAELPASGSQLPLSWLRRASRRWSRPSGQPLVSKTSIPPQRRRAEEHVKTCQVYSAGWESWPRFGLDMRCPRLRATRSLQGQAAFPFVLRDNAPGAMQSSSSMGLDRLS